MTAHQRFGNFSMTRHGCTPASYAIHQDGMAAAFTGEGEPLRQQMPK